METTNDKTITGATKAPAILIPQELQTKLTDALHVLSTLKTELLERQAGMHKQTTTLKAKVEEVQELSGTNEDSKLIELFEKTSQDYQRLIENTLKETDFYSQFYQAYIDSPSEQIQALMQQDVSRLEAHVNNEAKLLRSFVKRRRRDFTVIFSRFDHGYANNMARLKAMQFHIERRKKHEEAHAE